MLLRHYRDVQAAAGFLDEHRSLEPKGHTELKRP
jgi:hypothetical protein